MFTEFLRQVIYRNTDRLPYLIQILILEKTVNVGYKRDAMV